MAKKLFFILFAAVLLTALTLSVSADGKEVYTVVLDPGHGGHDPGTDVGTRYESEYNYDVALLLKAKLEANGNFKVILTRERSEYKKYLERALVADKANADLLISVHFNSTAYNAAKTQGVEVLASVLDEWSPDTLSNSILDSISKKCGLKNRGVKKERDTGDSRGVYYWNEEFGWDVPGVKSQRVSDYYSMISWGTKLGFPAIIVEHAYLSNKSDLAFCDSENGLKLLAEAEAEAIIKYFTGHTHTYQKSTDRRANCCLEGVESEKCTVCGHRRNVTKTHLAPNAHLWTVDSRKVTCTSDGYVYRECQISRNLSEKGLNGVKTHTQTETVSSPGHIMVTVTNTEASHGNDGIFKERCSVCGYVNEVITPGDPHVYTVVTSTPKSCTVNGREVYRCTSCDDSYEVPHPAEGHDYVSGDEALNCASDGTKEYVCKNCGDVVSENIEVPPHKTELKIDRTPTCEEDGLRRKVCTVCGFTEEQILSKIGHDYGEGKTVTEPDYFAEGSRKFVCKNDKNHVKEEILPKKSGGEFIITCTVAGSVVLLAIIILPFIILGRKKLRAISAESAEVLEEAAVDLDDSASVEAEEPKEISEEELPEPVNKD